MKRRGSRGGEDRSTICLLWNPRHVIISSLAAIGVRDGNADNPTPAKAELLTRAYTPPQKPVLRGLVIIAGLFAFGLAATYSMESAGLDIAWTADFYRAGGAHEGWIYARDLPWGLLYDYGEIPAWVLLGFAVALYAAVLWGKARADYKRACLVIMLTIALGPGLLVNGVLKNSWGRPRPAAIAAFGGPSAYHKVWEMGRSGEGKSFTCGHCAMAFAISSAAAFYPFHPVAAIVALIAGIAYGILMGVARVAQGGHFPTDVLWSGIIVLALLVALYYLVFRVPQRQIVKD